MKPFSLFLKVATALLLASLFSQCTWGQAPDSSATTPELYFYTLPSKQLFSLREPVGAVLQLYSRSDQSILVSRLQGNEFVSFKVIGPDGNEVPWHGEERSSAQRYSSSDFIVLNQYKQISANRIISLKDGSGFAFDKPGQYSLTAEFSMGSAENYVAFADQAKPAMGTFRSTKLSFCIEACIFETLPVRNNVPQAALEAVRVFYTHITRHPQLGIPSGLAKKALRPLLSKRLAQEIDSLDACDEDYYRRFGEVLRANTYKPSTPWLEQGLFTGPDDAATPFKFRIVGSRAIGENRVDVELRFTTKQTYSRDLGLPPSYEHYGGDVTVILENSRWVVDDYVAMYGNDELLRLSAGYPDCKGGRWVSEGPY